MARLLEFSMPTMCVFNGNAIAGGYIFGLCHDFRIMNNDVGSICLSELKLGMSIFLPFMKVVSSKLPSNVCTNIINAVTIEKPEALRTRLIDSTYSGAE